MTLLGWIRVINRPKDLQGVVGEGCKGIYISKHFVWDYTQEARVFYIFETFCMGLKGMPGKSITGAFEGLRCGLYRGSS